MQIIQTKSISALTVGFISSTILSTTATQVQAVTFTVGQNDGGNCYPFSCFASDNNGSTYQQIYDSAAFSSPSYINSISFFQNSGGIMDTASYNISFSTTSASVSGLDSTWANNIGADSAVFGSFTVSGTMPTTLTFAGTPFYFDPAMGNLLMTVQVSNLTFSAGYSSFFQADYTGNVTQRLWAYGGSSVGSLGSGALVTQFNTSPAPVPEPLTILGSMAAIGVTASFERKFVKKEKKKE